MVKVRDGIYGLCVADALGVPVECRTRKELRKTPVTGMIDGAFMDSLQASGRTTAA